MRGASAVLTPSPFVRCADWPSLRAVLRAGRSSGVADLHTLVATDAAVLQPQYLATFLEALRTDAGDRALAVAFADAREPLAKRERLAGLRALRPLPARGAEPGRVGHLRSEE